VFADATTTKIISSLQDNQFIVMQTGSNSSMRIIVDLANG
jgi:hypothetical protein